MKNQTLVPSNSPIPEDDTRYASIDISISPGDGKKIAGLLKRHSVIREDDTAETAAIRLASMALVLANIASGHMRVLADGVEHGLATDFIVEGGITAADFTNSVIGSVEWIQGRYERNTLYDVAAIARVVYSLPVALGYGLKALHLHKTEIDGSEVMAWAKWLVLRMLNRVAAARATGKDSRAERLAAKLAEKLATEGPMKVRDLSRRINRLKAVDCRKALNLLAEQGIAGEQDGVCGILGNAGEALASPVTERKAG